MAENEKRELSTIEKDLLYKQVVDVIRSCYDPEIPVNIYDLGLIYDVVVGDEGKVHIRMTLTSPACPVAGSLPREIEMKVKRVSGVTDTLVEVVWDPPWNPNMMTEEARLELGL
jgi:FeS assembly SUF system protein